MKKTFIILFALLMSTQFLISQEFSTHVYRRVAPEHMEEYIRREVTYWSKFAESEIKKGNLTFWAIMERVGGENQEYEPNILMVNSYKDIDRKVNWNAIVNLFPNMKFKDIETSSLSKTTTTVFLRDLGNHIQGPNVVPERDFKYVRLNYHNMKDIWWHLNFEEQKVKPFFQKGMDEGKTSIKGWGNAYILTPKSEAFPYKTESYDLFSSLKDALGPNDFPDMDFPEGFFEEWQENYVGERNVRIYRIIKVVDVNNVVK